MKNTVIVAGITLVLLAVLVVGIYISSKNPPDQKTLSAQVSANDHILGDPTMAKAVLIEYGDYQCPACAYYFPVVKQLAQEYNGRMIFVFRHFPLPQHKNALPAAYAAEAAARQGKFWDMHDLIYEHQADWQDASDAENIFDGYAGQIGLDLNKFKNDVKSSDISAPVQNDLQSGRNANVNSTPSFFLNGIYIQPANLDDFKKLIDSALGS